MLRFKLSAKDGKAAHSAYPWLGKNAILDLNKDIESVLATRYPEGSEHEGSLVFNNPNTNPTASQGKKGFPNWYTTMVPTLISGGTAVNQVPGSATATIDVRYTEAVPLVTLKEWIGSQIHHCDIDFFFEQPMLESPPDTAFMVEARHEMEEILGRSVELNRGHGTSDGHWAPGFCIVMYKPEGGGLHQVDEWVDFDSLMIHHAINVRLTMRWSCRT